MNIPTNIVLPRAAVDTVTAYLDEHGIQYETRLLTLKSKTISVDNLPIHALSYIRAVTDVAVKQEKSE